MSGIMFAQHYYEESDGVVPMDIDTDDEDNESVIMDNMKNLYNHFLKMTFDEKDKRNYIVFNGINYYGIYQNAKDVANLLLREKELYVRCPNGIFVYPKMNLRYNPKTDF